MKEIPHFLCILYINTLMVEDLLKDDGWLKRLITEDFRGLIQPFVFMSSRMDVEIGYDSAACSYLITSMRDRKQSPVTGRTSLSKNPAPGDSLRNNRPFNGGVQMI